MDQQTKLLQEAEVLTSMTPSEVYAGHQESTDRQHADLQGDNADHPLYVDPGHSFILMSLDNG